MKKKSILATLALSALLVGCGTASDDNKTTPTTEPTTAATEAVDVVTTASIVNDEASFETAIGSAGTWIIAPLQDMTFSKDIVLEGDFSNSKGEVQRKVALYSQDADRNITARYTLTAPKLTVNSPNASLQHGMYVGDIYVESTDFQLIDTKVTGNIYFATEEAKAGFVMDADSSVSGTQEVSK